MEPRDELSIDLRAETATLRRIARGILLEPSLAEDAVQEAWLAALRAPDGAPRSGGWLTEAVRRIALGMRRGEARRARREHAGARQEFQPSAGDTAGRVELLRELLEALAALEEPYRTAVQLRLVDDLPPRAIAERTGVPVETARTRVKRGIEQLRARLDARHAHRRTDFLAALAPLAGFGRFEWTLATAGGAKTIGGVLVGTKVKLALVMAVVVAAGVLVWRTGLAGPELEDPGALARAEAPAELPRPVEPVRAPDAAPAGLAVGDGPERDAARREGAVEQTWRLRGRTMRGAEGPLPGARVQVEVVAGYEGPGEALFDAEVVSDGAGAFEVALRPPSTAVRVKLRAQTPGFIGFQRGWLVLRGAPPPEDLEVALYPLDVTIRGTVLDAQGAPIASAKVDSRGHAAACDREGRFHVLGSSLLGDEPVTATAPGFAAGRVVVQTTRAGVVEGIELRLVRSLALRGRVLDADGQAVAGAFVESWAARSVSATSDVEGRFVLDGFAPDATWISVNVEAAGYARLQHEFRDGKLPAEELEFRLQRGLDVAGRVVDEAGAPVPGTDVHAGSSSHDPAAVRAVAGDDGRFVLRNVPREERVFGAHAEGFAPLEGALELPATGPHEGELAIVLSKGRTVRGTVVDARGAALPGVGIAVQRGGYVYVEGLHGSTGENGGFELHGVPFDRGLELEFYRRGIVRRQVPIDPAPGAHHRVVLERSAGLAGIVVDATTKAPVQAFRVRLVYGALQAGEEMLTGYSATWAEGREVRDEQGRWDTRDEEVAAGQVAGVEVSAPGYAPTIVPRAVTTTDFLDAPIVVELGPGARVRGQVVDVRDGRPIAGALVRRFTARDPNGPWGRDGEEPLRESRTDARGEFAFDGLPLEPMSLYVELAGLAPAVDGPFECDAATPARRIELAPGAALLGALRDHEGRPMAGEPVRVSADEVLGLRHRDWQLETDADGRFELRDLAPGTYQVVHELEHEGGSIFDLGRTLTIAEAKEHAVELRPMGSCRLVGTARAAGAAPRVMTVSLFRKDAGPDSVRRAALAHDGRFEVDGLEPGRWTVTLHEAGVPSVARRYGHAEVDVVEGREAVVDVELRER